MTVVQDDGFLDYKTWVEEHLAFFKLYLFGGAIIYLNYIFFEKNIRYGKIYEISLKFNTFKESIWPYILFSIFVGALISSCKVGGNAGNTAFGFSVLLPMLYLYLNKYLSVKKIFYMFIFVNCPLMIYSGISKYKLATEFSYKVQEIVHGSKNNILTGSNVYYSTRFLRYNNEIFNYWMYSVRDNNDVYNYLEKTSKISDFDYLIVENWPQNKIFLNGNINYKVLFQNELGIIAKKVD